MLIIIFIQDNPFSVISTGIKGDPVIEYLSKNTKSLKDKKTLRKLLHSRYQ